MSNLQFVKLCSIFQYYQNYTQYRYKLRATEIQTGASSSTDVVINIVGEQPTMNYVMELKAKKDITRRPDIEEEIQIIDLLRSSSTTLMTERINDVSFRREGDSVAFKWSLCTSDIIQCDCQRIGRLERSFDILKKNLQAFMVVESITGHKRGACSEGPMLLNPITKDLQAVPVGQCYSIKLPNNLYHDRQDGRNVRYFIQSEDGVPDSEDDWLQIDQSGSRLCGIVPYQTYLDSISSNTPSNTYTFQVGAEDTCSNRIANTTEIRINPKTYLFPDLALIGVFKGTKRDFMRNCTRIELMVNKIAEYSKVNKTKILVKDIRVIDESGNSNSTEITWGYRIGNCTNQTFISLYDRFFTTTNTKTNTNERENAPKMRQEFSDFMRPDFEFQTLSHSREGDCVALVPATQAFTGSDELPLWWVWVLLAVAAIVLLLWLLWLCCPRACPNCWGETGLLWMCCGKCCAPSGDYSSFKGVGVSPAGSTGSIEAGL